MTKSDEKEASSVTQAYTPGLKVKRSTVINEIRRLPIPGEILVKEGDTVGFDKIVARAMSTGDPNIVLVCNQLDVTSEDIQIYMTKKIGDPIKKGDIIAKRSFLFGMFKSVCTSPIDGTLEQLSEVSGTAIIRALPIPVELESFIPGKIVRTIPREGVEIQTHAAVIQGIFGIGGEGHGELILVTKSNDEIMEASMVNSSHKGKIIAGGSYLSLEVLKKAVEIGVNGIVVGGMDQEDLIKFLGYEIGVAITGQEETKLTLILTEGFGNMPMSKRTFNLLKDFEGYMCAINGTTQIRAGVIRPEIIIPHDKVSYNKDEDNKLLEGMKKGIAVRIIRQPYFGAIGTVTDLPVELQKVDTGSLVRVVEVLLENEKKVTVPRANVEIIEE